ncbi:MAG TPA: cell division protein ZapA [Burkholderiaceae bacterium]|nr:cell division protein ZapA [Burkholderiaceae bacterium]
MPELAVENVAVKIMGRDYVFACSADERDSLLRCVALVDDKMNSVKMMGKLGSIDRIAVMAALMIANELIALRDSEPKESHDEALAIEETLRRMQSLSEEIRQFVDDTQVYSTSSPNELFRH